MLFGISFLLSARQKKGAKKNSPRAKTPPPGPGSRRSRLQGFGARDSTDKQGLPLHPPWRAGPRQRRFFTDICSAQVWHLQMPFKKRRAGPRQYLQRAFLPCAGIIKILYKRMFSEEHIFFERILAVQILSIFQYGGATSAPQESAQTSSQFGRQIHCL